MAILFGCHGNIKKKNFFNDNSSETTESVGLLLVQILLGYGQFQIVKKFGSLPLGLVAMATESCHSLIMGKWFNCTFSITSEVMSALFGSYDHLMIVYPVYMFYDQWPFCLVAMITFNFEKGLFQMTTSKPLQQYDSNLVQKLLG